MEVLAGNFTSPHSEGGEIAEASGISCPLCEKHLSLLTWLSAIFLSIMKCVLTEDLWPIQTSSPASTGHAVSLCSHQLCFAGSQLLCARAYPEDMALI